MKFQANDFAGAATVLHRAVELDPADPVPHQFLFLTLQKLGKKDDSFAEYVPRRFTRSRTGRSNAGIGRSSASASGP